MHITMQLLLVAVAACVCLSEGAADGRVARAKQQRPTRGFKNVEMMTARGFGKRGRPSARTEQEIRVRKEFKLKPRTQPLIAWGYGKRKDSRQKVYGLDNFWEMLENSPEREGQEINDDKTLESIPLDWFVREVVNNPDFARSLIRKFIDVNQDGMLSSDELLRNVV